MRRTALLFSSLLGLSALGCSEGSPSDTKQETKETSVTQDVGPDGALLELAGATVTFPKGALAKSTSITIEASEESAPDGFTALSPIFKCSPSGLSFDPKVTMAMEFEADEGKATMFWSSGEDPSFTDVGGTVSGNVMSAGVAHFSRGFVGHPK